MVGHLICYNTYFIWRNILWIKKRVVPIWLSVVLLSLCVASAIGVVFLFTKQLDILSVIICVLFLCAIAMAILYCFMGYKKNAAKFFAIFSVILTLAVFLQIIHYFAITDQQMNQPEAAVETMIPMEAPQGEAPADLGPGIPVKNIVKIGTPVLIFGILFVLTIAKDLGKKKSYILIGSAVALSLVGYVIGFAGTKNNMFDFEIFFASGVEFSILILCVIYGIMIYAKYVDKEARGTK